MEKLRLGDGIIMKHYVRRRPRRSSQEVKDRLSSLPDAILTDILSRLTIHSAATTSVLSHRWRHLWTTVTGLQIGVDDRLKSTTINHILRQVRSPKLRFFNLDYLSLFYSPGFSESEPWFREICRRNVENFTLNVSNDFPFRIPSCLLNSKSLVVLKLNGLLKSKSPKNGDLSLCLSFHLPNLKILSLSGLDNVPIWLSTLIRSCPILEELSLFFELNDRIDPSPPHFVVDINIIAPNLKSIYINMQPLRKMQRTHISMDAPKLINLDILDWSSIYRFVRNPTTLVKARISLKRFGNFGELVNWGGNYYLEETAKFVGGLSSVSDLQLMLESHSNIFGYPNFGNLPIFSNVVNLETNFFKDLLFSLECFPNLEHLVVSVWSQTFDLAMEQRYWLPPNIIPDCLSSKLRTIKIKGLQAIGDDLRMLAYILSNANVLEKLCIDVRMMDVIRAKNEREEAHIVWKEGQFCKSLFKLPRSSSTCEVLVSGRSVNAFGNALQNGYLTCQMYVGK